MNTKLHDLPIEERLRLVEALWDSIAADAQALPLTEAQRAELDSRLDAYAIDRIAGRPGAEVLRDLRQRL